MRFMLLMIPAAYGAASPEARPSADAVAAMMKFNEDMLAAGVLLSLEGLHPPASGTRVTFRNGKVTEKDGPFPDVPEAVGGFWMIGVGSQAEAVDWARKCPVFHDAVIEVRQVMEMEEHTPEAQEAARDFAEKMEID